MGSKLGDDVEKADEMDDPTLTLTSAARCGAMRRAAAKIVAWGFLVLVHSRWGTEAYMLGWWVRHSIEERNDGTNDWTATLDGLGKTRAWLGWLLCIFWGQQ